MKPTKEPWFVANEELDGRMVNAICGKDLAGLMSCFHQGPELVAVLWGTEMHGTAEIRQAIESLFSRYEALKLSLDRVERVHSGDFVLAVGHATWTLTAEGKVTTLCEVWTDVRRLVDGNWVYLLNHAEILPGA